MAVTSMQTDNKTVEGDDCILSCHKPQEIVLQLNCILAFFSLKSQKRGKTYTQTFMVKYTDSKLYYSFYSFQKMDIFVCWLALKYILLLLTHFQKTNTMAIVTTRASADVTKM